MHAGRRTSRGFTLLEVIVASAMVSLLIGGVSVSLHVAHRARRSTVERIEPVRTARMVMEAVARDLQAAVPPTGVLAGEFVGTDGRNESGDADTLRFCGSTAASASILDAVEAADAAAESRTSVAASPARRGDVRAMSYRLATADELAAGGNVAFENGEASENEGPAFRLLVRREEGDALAAESVDPTDRVLCRRAVSLNLRYYDGSQWLDEWDSTTRDNALPTAVEVTVGIATEAAGRAGSAVIHQARRIVPLPCASQAVVTDVASAPPAGVP